MAVDVEVLFQCLDCSFAESICLRVKGSWQAKVDVQLPDKLLAELVGKLKTTVGSDMWRNSMKVPKLEDVFVRNICCYAGCLC